MHPNQGVQFKHKALYKAIHKKKRIMLLPTTTLGIHSYMHHTHPMMLYEVIFEAWSDKWKMEWRKVHNVDEEEEEMHLDQALELN
uniref:Uncharacterized protein n=1 Tax=Vitis vinifera TaxID=29760 RepID=F6HT43_VITVI